MIRRAVAVGATVLVAALGLVLGAPADASPRTSAHVSAPAFPPKRPTKVLVLGDSVMAGAVAQYGPALPGRDVTVDAMVNRSTNQGAEVVAQRGADWDVVVILLAHNDGGSPGVYQPAANRILDQLAGVPRVVWLSLHEVRPYYVTVNQFLRDQATRRPNLRVADWNAEANAHPEAVVRDGLHLTSNGIGVMSTFVAAQVELAERDDAAALAGLAGAARRRRDDAAKAKLAAAIAADAAKARLADALADQQAKARAAAKAKAAAAKAAAAKAAAAEAAADRSRAQASTTTVRSVDPPAIPPPTSSGDTGFTGYGLAVALVALGVLCLLAAVGLLRKTRRRARADRVEPTATDADPPSHETGPEPEPAETKTESETEAEAADD